MLELMTPEMAAAYRASTPRNTTHTPISTRKESS
jgi:hypothetical protein